jgi:hypothetical protein
VERGDDRHSQFAQERQQVEPGGPAEDPELVLHADDVHVPDVQEVRGALIGRDVLLLDLVANDVRIVVPALDVVDRHGEALAARVFGGHAGQQVGRERGDAALARQVVAHERDPPDLGARFLGVAQLRPSRLGGLRIIGVTSPVSWQDTPEALLVSSAHEPLAPPR